MRKYLICIFLSAFATTMAQAQEPEPVVEVTDSLTDTYLDTVKVERALKINDYSMIGVNFGAGRAQTAFNPAKSQQVAINAKYFGITYTKYGKFFGYMPYFGFQIGFFHGQDGYAFKPNKDGIYNVNVDGATKCVYNFVEAPFVAQFHVDSYNFKLLIDAGMYVGYRYKLHREGPYYKYQDYMDDFTDFEYKWDYGFKAGGGVGLIFSPIEIHFKLNLRYGLGSLYRADYNDREYYRFAYPFDLYLTVGLHYQLGRRTGKTKSQLKKEARTIVYGE